MPHTVLMILHINRSWKYAIYFSCPKVMGKCDLDNSAKPPLLYLKWHHSWWNFVPMLVKNFDIFFGLHALVVTWMVMKVIMCCSDITCWQHIRTSRGKRYFCSLRCSKIFLERKSTEEYLLLIKNKMNKVFLPLNSRWLKSFLFFISYVSLCFWSLKPWVKIEWFYLWFK